MRLRRVIGKMKRAILTTLKWAFLLSFFGSGWFVFFTFGLPKGSSELGLPIGELEEKQFWNSRYEGDFPKALREKGNVIIVALYGFWDTEKIGLVKLGDQETEDLLNRHLRDIPTVKDESLWREGTLCGGVGAFSWKIQKGSVQDYFDFCYTVSRQDFKEVKKLELKKLSEDGSTHSYMDIDHIIGTNYFVIAHGGG